MLYHMCQCGALIPQNMRLCDKCAAASSDSLSRHMEYNRYRRDKRKAAFYVSAEWRKARAAAIAAFDGVDIYAFYILHKVVAADMVHHIIPIDDDWSKRFDLDNLIPLSSSSHNTIESLYDKDDVTKRATQRLLRDLMARHAAGG